MSDSRVRQVLFHNAAEYLEELQKELGKVYRNIVRVTLLRHTRDSWATFYLISSAFVDETLLHLKEGGGTCPSYDRDEQERFWKLGIARVEQLSAQIGELGLEVRNGKYE